MSQINNVFRFSSEMQPICWYLNASKLLTSENSFLYYWQYSSTNLIFFMGERGSTMLCAYVLGFLRSYTTAKVTNQGYD
jgi:hypothetical protein